MSILPLALLLISSHGLQLESELPCPSTAMLEERLSKLPPEVTEGYRLVLTTEQSGRVRLQLFDALNRSRDDLRFEANLDCEQMAEAIAVVLQSSSMSLEEAPPLEPPVLVIQSRPQSPPPQQSDPARHSAAAATVGGGLLMASAVPGGQLAWGGLLRGSIALHSFRLRPELTLGYAGGRGLALGTGKADWQRLWAGPGIEYRALDAAGGGWWLSLHASAQLAADVASGVGYRDNQSGSTFDLGLAAGVRVGWRAPNFSLAPWFGAWLSGWPLARTVFLGNQQQSATLPPVDLQVTAGLDWGS